MARRPPAHILPIAHCICSPPPLNFPYIFPPHISTHAAGWLAAGCLLALVVLLLIFLHFARHFHCQGHGAEPWTDCKCGHPVCSGFWRGFLWNLALQIVICFGLARCCGIGVAMGPQGGLYVRYKLYHQLFCKKVTTIAFILFTCRRLKNTSKAAFFKPCWLFKGLRGDLCFSNGKQLYIHLSWNKYMTNWVQK